MLLLTAPPPNLPPIHSLPHLHSPIALHFLFSRYLLLPSPSMLLSSLLRTCRYTSSPHPTGPRSHADGNRHVCERPWFGEQAQRRNKHAQWCVQLLWPQPNRLAQPPSRLLLVLLSAADVGSLRHRWSAPCCLHRYRPRWWLQGRLLGRAHLGYGPL